MKTLMKLTLFTLLCIWLATATAQIQIKGNVITICDTLDVPTPSVVRITHISNGHTTDVYPNAKGKYRIPYWLEKNYVYSIRITDGTVERVVIFYGAAPEAVFPYQRILLDIDLTNVSNADRTLIFYYSEISCKYEHGHLDELNKFEHLMYAPWGRRSMPSKF